jgi:prolyl oligopeptidase
MSQSSESSQPIALWPPLADETDPYIGLEALDSPAVDAWVRAQNARTTSAFGNSARVNALTKRIVQALTAADRIVECWRCNEWGYDLWTDETHPLGVVRRTPWQAWLDGRPEWETVLDVNGLDLNQGDETRWIVKGFDLIYPTYDRALVALSPGGSDAVVIREFDVARKSFVDDGFVLSEPGLHSVSWIDRDTVYVAWDDSASSVPPALTASGYPRQIRRWKRGARVMDAPVVFEGGRDDISVHAAYDPVLRRHSVWRAKAFSETEHFWLDEVACAWRRYEVPPSADIHEWHDWLIVYTRREWAPHGSVHAGGSLLAIRRKAFLEGDRRFHPLFVPTDGESLADIALTKAWLVVTRKCESVSQVTLWRPSEASDQAWESRGLALPTACNVSVSAIDPDRDDTVLIHLEHFLVPPSLHYADLGADEPWRLLAQLPARFDAIGFVAERRLATARDGVEIPYWVIGRAADLGVNSSPCLLYGYGGFEVAVDEPAYLDTTGFEWLEPGGVFAIACIRGGAEFGPAWHQAALRERRQVAFDDFFAVAEALIDTGVTTPGQLAITGASNGGLLTAACMVQRPELFGAVISEVPVLDMARFHLLLQGAAWIDEYGDPDDADDLRVLMAYSPYQNLKAGVTYPPVLFATSSTDDRVHPGHARKMAARMQALGLTRVWFLEHDDGGHGAGVEPLAMARAAAISNEFLWTMLRSS